MRRLAVLAALAAPVLALGCARNPGAVQVPAGTPVVLISIDTLRSDHLPAYGYSGVATPAIDALRRDGILYQRAYSHTPLTLPSHTSLLTGLLPGAHGVRDNVGYALDAERIRSHQVPFLPEMLHERGYATGAGVSAFVLSGKTGLATGFDLYEDSIETHSGAGLGGLQRPGGDTLRRVLPWLRGAAGKPFFLFFHLYEPHTPYEPPPELRARSGLPYDGDIAAADRVVGELLAELRRLDAYERAIVVLLSDHGEGLGEHGEDEHGILLYREAIQVPLIVKLPRDRYAGRAVTQPVALSDVAPTVAALLKMDRPASWRGTSLLAFLDRPPAPRRIYSETFYPRLHFGWSELASLVDGEHHLVSGPTPELFDLRVDPGERRNVLLGERRLYGAWRRDLEGYAVPLQPPSAVDEETRQAMVSLGYVGSAGPTSGALPDPRSELPSLARLKAGFQQMHDRDYAGAERTFGELVDENPQMVDAWEFLGKARSKQGRPDEALVAYQEALRRSGGAPHIAQEVASLLFDLGRLDDAAAHARLAESTMPSFTHGLLARVALRRKQLDEADRQARLAMATSADRLLPRLTLADVLEARGQYEQALAVLGEARKLYAERSTPDPELVKGLHLTEGKVRADLGQATEAEAAFRQEIRLFPDDPRAYAALALLYALTGRQAEAATTLQAMTEASPTAIAYAEAVRVYRSLHDERGAATVLRFARRKFPGSEVLADL
ncbi:MAG TPA: sulfatase-like hydrolase/transferase [Thermoanaerobaculia bacterium]|jgi:tetratricopeptide (TPR) repeat protein|nr:sulfatase-like hydrolase/transferase [Thermoanaerobaculia bacterium]